MRTWICHGVTMKSAIASLAIVLLVSGCGSSTDESASPGESGTGTPTSSSPTLTPALRPEPKDLTCPTKLRVSTAGGLQPAGSEPEGYTSAEQAVEDWIGDGSTFGLGTAYRISDDGTSAWLLRKDGTAYASLPIREESDRYFTEGYTACDGLVD